MAKKKLVALYGLFFAFVAALICAFALFAGVSDTKYASAEELTTLDVSGTQSGAKNDFSSGWTELSTYVSENGTTLSGGKYYLSGDVTLTDADITINSGTVTIDLNGYILTGTGNGSVITVSEGATLNLEDSNGANRTYYYTEATNSVASTVSTSSADAAGSFTGGVITGGTGTQSNSYIYGGGVYVDGTFTMNGGALVGNTATYGGGVYVGGTATYVGGVYVSGTFTMNGGTISGNTASNDGYGGGVYISSSYVTFTMNGGTISGNAAFYGGGVSVYSASTFTMNGGTISDNEATYGGGVHLYSNNRSSFSMTGGTISGNKATLGGGVYVPKIVTFAMYDGTISDNTASSGGGVYSGTFTMYGGTISDNTASNGGGVYTVSTFTMEGGTISGNTATNGNGGVYVYNSVTFNMSGGYLGGNTASSSGNNIYNGGSITITGGYFDEGSVEDNTVAGVTVAENYIVYQTGDSTWAYCVVKDVTVSVTASGTSSVYDGNPISADEDFTLTVLSDNTVTADYTAEYSYTGTYSGSGLPKNAGEYTITVNVTVDGIYKASTEFEYTINKAQLSAPTASEKEYTYNGEEQTFELAGVDESLMTISGNVQTAAGEYTVTVSLKDKENYTWADGTTADLTFDFEIAKATIDLSGASWEYTAAFTYTGDEHSVTLTGLPEGVTASYEGNTATNAGTYTATVTYSYDSDNYSLVNVPSALTWSIAKATVAKPTASDTTYTYTGSEQTYTPNGYDGSTMTISGNAQTNAGEYTVTVSLKDKENYTWADGTTADLTFDFEIAKAAIDLSGASWEYTAAFTYTGDEHSVTLTGLPENVTANYEGNSATNAGTYTATVTYTYDSDNYSLVNAPSALTWSIAKATVAKPTASDTTYTYTGSEQTYTPNGYDGSTMTISGNAQTNAGEYTVTVSLKDSANYTWADGTTADLTFDFEIAKATIDLSGASWEYTAAFTYTGDEHSVSLTGLPEGVTASYEGNSATNAGTYTATATYTYDSDNYSLVNAPSALSWEIAKATVAKPTASDTTYTYTGSEQTYTPNGYDGSTMTISGNAQTNAGEYTVTVSLKDSANYTWADGTTADLTFTFTIEESGLGAGAIAGIVIGCIVGALLIAYAVCAILFKKGLIKGAFFEKIYPFIK